LSLSTSRSVAVPKGVHTTLITLAEAAAIAPEPAVLVDPEGSTTSFNGVPGATPQVEGPAAKIAIPLKARFIGE